MSCRVVSCHVISHVMSHHSIHVIFGKVIDGFQFVTEMESQKVDVNHRPYADVRITHSGELVLLKKSECDCLLT